MVGKPSLTVPPNSSNSSCARSALRSVVSMGSLRRCATGEQVSSPLDSVLHGFGEGAAQGAGVAAGADSPQSFDLDLPFFFNDAATTEIYTLSLPARRS